MPGAFLLWLQSKFLVGRGSLSSGRWAACHITMHQETLIKAVDSHLGELETLLGTALAVAILVFWSGVRGHKEVSVAGLKLTRRHAFFIVGAFYSLINVAILIGFLRLNATLSSVTTAYRVEALTVLGTHKWVFNPFAFYGDSLLAQVSSVWGFGALIVSWWFCLTSIFLFGAPQDGKRAGATLARDIICCTFLAVGLASMLAIDKVNLTVQSFLHDIPKEIAVQIENTATARQIITFGGIALGTLIFLVSPRLARMQKSNDERLKKLEPAA